MFYLSRAPEHAATRKDNTVQGPNQVVGMVGADIFMINDENSLFIVDYYSRFLVKNVESLSAKDLIRAVKIIFVEFVLSKKDQFQMQA